MRAILEELNLRVGARGSLVVTRDGIPIASSSRVEFHEERVAALAQKVIRESARALEGLSIPGFEQFVLTADCGRMIFVELSVAYLVVITQLSVDPEQAMLEIQSSARRIERASRIAI